MSTNTPLFEIDFSKKLEVKISNENPVVLVDLTISLMAISQQYQKFIESQTNENYNASTELYIKEVKSGSIIVELVTQAMPVLPLLWNDGSLVEWINQLSNTFTWLLGKDSPPQNYSKQDLKQLHSIIEPVAKDSGSQLNFTVKDQGNVTINQFFINSEQANAAQNRIMREIDLLNAPDDNIHRKRVMYWKQAKFDDDSHAGDKAIIESISKSPVKVLFENNAVKKAMLAGDSRFHKPWQRLAYIVDVSVQTIQDTPKLYTIINFYDSETFDPEA